MENLKLTKKIIIEGNILAVTGLHIGGNSVGMEIGGADSVVIRNPINNRPYIPGSSIKGKMRSLLEKIYGLVIIDPRKISGDICKDPNEDVVQLFGFAANEAKESEKEILLNSAPTRLIVRDAHLTDESFEMLNKLESTDMFLTELKTETVIDRLTSKANPRTFERVPAGSEFKFQFVIDIYNCDDTREKDLINLVAKGMELLEFDYLGGNGTRGYGQVKFNNVSVFVKTAENYIKNEQGQKNAELNNLFSNIK